MNSKTDFMNNNVTVGAFSFHANETGEVLKDGTVYFDLEGQAQYHYSSVADFVNHALNGTESNYTICQYVGERTDGKIEYFDGHSFELDGVDDADDDGDAIYSAPITYTTSKRLYIVTLELPGGESVAPYLFESHRVFCEDNAAQTREKLFLFEALEMKAQLENYGLDSEKAILDEDFYIEIKTPVNATIKLIQ